MFSYAGSSSCPGAAFAGPLWRVADSRSKRAEQARVEAREQAVARVLSRDAVYAAKVKRVRRYQARLRGQLSERGWQAYLQLEEAELARWGHALECVARWALAVRRRTRRRGVR